MPSPEPAAPPLRGGSGVVRLARAFVVFVCLVMLAANVWVVLGARAQELEQARLANQNLARAIAQQMDALFGETEHVLGSLVFELDQHELDATTLERMQPNLVHEVSQLDHLEALYVIDAQGRWLAYSQPLAAPDASGTDHEYFIEHRNSPSERLRIGAPLRLPGGRWVIPVSRRLNDAYGRFSGVMLATVSIERLVRVLAAYDLGGRGAIMLGRRDGVVLTRWPLRDQDLGRDLSATSAYQALMAGSHGTFESNSPLDGEHRLVSFQHTRNLPLYVTVARSHEEVMADWQLSAVLQTAWTLALCVVVGAAGAYIVRAVRRRSVAETALRHARDALAQANLQLSHLASHDALTGLANRRALDTQLQQALAARPTPTPPPALLMIDVDNFKRYNDLHGHLAGDECLVLVAAAIRAVAEAEGGFAARFGGEEMALLLAAHPDPSRVAEAVRARIAALRVSQDERSPQVTVSIGLAVLGPARQTVAAWLGAADDALYAAKAAGRNRVVISEGA